MLCRSCKSYAFSEYSQLEWRWNRHIRWYFCAFCVRDVVARFEKFRILRWPHFMSRCRWVARAKLAYFLMFAENVGWFFEKCHFLCAFFVFRKSKCVRKRGLQLPKCYLAYQASSSLEVDRSGGQKERHFHSIDFAQKLDLSRKGPPPAASSFAARCFTIWSSPRRFFINKI